MNCTRTGCLHVPLEFLPLFEYISLDARYDARPFYSSDFVALVRSLVETGISLVYLGFCLNCTPGGSWFDSSGGDNFCAENGQKKEGTTEEEASELEEKIQQAKEGILSLFQFIPGIEEAFVGYRTFYLTLPYIGIGQQPQEHVCVRHLITG